MSIPFHLSSMLMTTCASLNSAVGTCMILLEAWKTGKILFCLQLLVDMLVMKTLVTPIQPTHSFTFFSLVLALISSLLSLFLFHAATLPGSSLLTTSPSSTCHQCVCVYVCVCVCVVIVILIPLVSIIMQLKKTGQGTRL